MAKEYKTEDDYEMIPLEEDQITEELKSMPGWERSSEQGIVREYKFKKYLDGVDFAKQCGEYAQKRKHHPSIQIDFQKVTVGIVSWRAKGVTELDIEMAKDFNEIYDNMAE